MMAYIAIARAFLKQIPWWAYLAAAVLAAFWWYGRTQWADGYEQGREAILSDLRAAEDKALLKAVEAEKAADAKGEQRALVEAQIVAGQIERIETAEAEGGNALDSLF